MELKRRSFPHVPFPFWVPLVLVLPALIALIAWASFPEMITVQGVMEPGEFCVLTAPRSGILELSRLNEPGEWTTGDVLFRLENQGVKAELEAAESAWSQAVAHSIRLEKELETRQRIFDAAVNVKEREALRYARLVGAGAVSQRERDTWKTASDREYEASLHGLTELSKDYAEVRMNLIPLLSRKEALEKERASLEFKAPFQGRILRTLVLDPSKPYLGTAPASGRFVEAGQVLGYFGKTGSLAVRLTVPDSARDRVAPGLKVRWYATGYPASRHREMTGYLSTLEPSPEPGFFWALVRPDQETIQRIVNLDLWGQEVIARLEVENRPLIDRWVSP